MRKIGIIGSFCIGTNVADGQSIKTRIVANEIEKKIGTTNVKKIDTFGWKKKPIKLLLNCINVVNTSDSVIFMTDAGGIKVFPWLLHCVNVFKKRPIYYVVIGGWLVGFLEHHKILRFFIKKLNGIFVETKILRNGLEKFGFKNVYLMPNFKDLQPIEEKQLSYSAKEPYKFCVFSRIMKEKGIENAIQSVKNINENYGTKVCTLDLYGVVDENQKEWFEELQNNIFSEDIHYGGVVPYNKSVEIIKEYYALLFPTEFFTEGVPGTIIDAYASGVPVIASEWESVYDVVEHGVTGVVYPFDKPDMLQECMIHFIENSEEVFKMKKKCLKKSKDFLPEAVIDVLISKLI